MNEWVREQVNTIPLTTVALPTHTGAATRLNSGGLAQLTRPLVY